MPMQQITDMGKALQQALARAGIKLNQNQMDTLFTELAKMPHDDKMAMIVMLAESAIK